MVLEDEHVLVPPENTRSVPGGSDQATNIPTDPVTSDMANQGGPFVLETGVSWIYRLRKEELSQELQKFRLDNTGTVDEMRKRLVNFMRIGPASPLVQRIPSPIVFYPPAPPVRPTATTSTSASLDPLSIRKWNIHFNGKGDPAAFIERLDEVCAYANFDHDQLLTVLPELLQDTPLLWYRNNKRFWKTWADFLRDFRTLHFPVNYLDDLEAEVSRRLQRVEEPVVTYLTDLQTLIRRHGGMTPEQELRWLYRNLLPDYRQYIKKTDFNDVPTLTNKVKEFEALRREVQEMYIKLPRRTVAATERTERSTLSYSEVTANKSTLPAPRQVAPDQDKSTRPPPERMPSQPSTSRLPIGVGNQVAANRYAAVNRHSVCWRCGKTGHIRTQCRSPPKLFCSRCGREGTLTRDCNCRQQEN